MANQQNQAIAESCTDLSGSSWSHGRKVATTLICRNALLHMRLRHRLADTGFLVVNTAFNDVSPLPAFPQTSPSLFILDADYEGGETAAVICRMKAQYPSARFVVLADHFDRDTLMEQHAAGADGFCLTSVGRDVLVRSLELVMLGQTMVPSILVLAMLQATMRRGEHPPNVNFACTNSFTPDPKARKLSMREEEILRFLTQGAPNKVIARKLDVAENTVKVHVKAILRKIGARNRTQAAMWATKHLPMANRASIHD